MWKWVVVVVVEANSFGDGGVADAVDVLSGGQQVLVGLFSLPRPHELGQILNVQYVIPARKRGHILEAQLDCPALDDVGEGTQ